MTRIVNEALEFDNSIFSNDEKRIIYIDIAYTYRSENNMEKAFEYAKKTEKVADKDSSHMIVAKEIIAEHSLKDEALYEEYKLLESSARKADYTLVANNLAMSIGENEKEDYKIRHKYFSKILAARGDDYNQIRAIVYKSLLSLEGNHIEDITKEYVLLLNQSYTYLYYQRFETLFNKCHKAIWTYLLTKNQYTELLNLFRHSSFIWRIFDDSTLEKKYFDELLSKKSFNISKIEKNSFNIVNIEYFNKRKTELEN